MKTQEYPPENIEAFQAENKGKVISSILPDLWSAFKDMPMTLKQVWWVKLVTWFGLPLMWQYLSLSIAYHVYDAPYSRCAWFC